MKNLVRAYELANSIAKGKKFEPVASKMLRRMADQMKKVVRAAADAGCPPVERCPYEGEIISRDVVCVECWQEWLDKEVP